VTWLQIIVLLVAGLGILAVLGAVVGMLYPGPDYMPPSPDEEYRWLTEDVGLTHDEAEDLMRGPPVH
jgi:hypothetical protein